MKKLLGLILAFSTTIPSYSQDQQIIDSLIQITESKSSASEVADAFVQIAFEYGGLDSAKSHFFAKKALLASKEINYETGGIDANYVWSRSLLLCGDYSKSEEYIGKVIKNAKRLNYSAGLANGYFAKAWLNYYQGSYDSSIVFHQKSLTLREEIGDKVEISNSLRGIGITYKLQGEFDLALRYLNRSLEIEKEVANVKGIAETLNHMGIIYGLRGDQAKALEFYFEALESQEKNEDINGLAYTYKNIGVVHFQLAEYETTLEYYYKCLDIRKDIEDTRGIAQISYDIGVVFHRLENFTKALEYYQEALRIKEEIGDKRGMADGYLNIGKLYADQKKYLKAIENQEKSLKIYEATYSDWGKANALLSLGQSYYYEDELNKARTYLIECLEIASKTGLSGDLIEAAKLLSSIEKDLGNYPEAFDALLLFQKMSDSLSSTEMAKRIALLDMEYDFKKEKDSIQFENAKQRIELSQKISDQRNLQLITFFTVLVLFATIIVLYRYYLLKNKSNKDLINLNNEIGQANRSLKALNTEKNNLIGIVAHDLKNPLANIIDASELLGVDQTKEDQNQLHTIIKTTASRMHKMISEILNVEEIEKSAEDITLKAYELSPTVTNVVSQYTNAAKAKNIKIHKIIQENIIAMVDERVIIQVIENLLSNAIKFSPPDKKVEVSLSDRYGKALLEIKDEGPGLSESDKAKLFQRFQRLSAKPTGNENSTGLGLSIVKKFVENMNGKIWCESTLGSGANFIVELPLYQNIND